MKDQRNFLQKTVFDLLDNLDPQTPALWGQMTPQHMVEHLSLLAVVSYGKVKIKPFYEEERIQKNYKYTITKRVPFRKNLKPPGIVDKLLPLRCGDLAEAIDKLKKEMGKFYAYSEANPEAKTLNPSLGELSFEDWEYFHTKHSCHHLAQFGLMTEEEAQI